VDVVVGGGGDADGRRGVDDDRDRGAGALAARVGDRGGDGVGAGGEARGRERGAGTERAIAAGRPVDREARVLEVGGGGGEGYARAVLVGGVGGGGGGAGRRRRGGGGRDRRAGRRSERGSGGGGGGGECGGDDVRGGGEVALGERGAGTERAIPARRPVDREARVLEVRRGGGEGDGGAVLVGGAVGWRGDADRRRRVDDDRDRSAGRL